MRRSSGPRARDTFWSSTTGSLESDGPVGLNVPDRTSSRLSYWILDARSCPMIETQRVSSSRSNSLAGVPSMNDQSPNADDARELQFDEAEFAAPAAGVPLCAACQQTIPDHYFQVNGAVLCERCSTAVRASLTGGSSLRRFVKAGFYGFGAAVAGFALYFGVLKLTGMEIGLISIVVGFMVGAAVRKGSEGRGGALYQLTAVFLTYL